LEGDESNLYHGYQQQGQDYSYVQTDEVFGDQVPGGSTVEPPLITDSTLTNANEETLQENTSESMGYNQGACRPIAGYSCIKNGLYVGRGGKKRTLTFIAQLSGPGEYVFESEALPGYYLTVDRTVNADGRPFLAESWGTLTAVRDPRHRFAIYAGEKEVQLQTTQF